MKPHGKFLLEEQDIQQVNSTKEIIGFNQVKKENINSNVAVLIGNPNFSLPEDKVTEVSRKIRGQKFDKDVTFNNIERNSDLTRATRDIELSSLPGTEIEIKDIEIFLKNKKWKVSTFTGYMAIKGAVKTAVNPRLLHIATHGMFLADIKKENQITFGFETQKLIENPLLRSGLFFTGANNLNVRTDNEENGLLTAYEAMNLNLDKTELVVLSACETGLGETKNGEGVFGLRRAFQQAGPKTIIMSLWSVCDDATQELMPKFYSYCVSGMSKRDSFNKAQLDIKTKYISPYYWGAFVMVGD